MAIGFPGRPGVEQSYTLTPSQKDQEFEIRDQGEAGWGLYDTQTKEWLTVVSRSGGREEVRAIGVRRDDAFSRMMAGVVHDTAVLYNDYASSELAVAPAVQPGASGTATTGTATGRVPVTKAPATGVPAIGTSTAAKVPATTAAAPATSATGTPATGTATAAGTPANSASANKPDTATALITRIDTPVIKPESAATPATRPDSAAALQPKSDPPAIHSGSNTAKADSPAPNSLRSGPPPATDASVRESLYRPIPSVVKLSERKLTRNMRIVYADKGKDAKSDTIVVIIPLDTPQTTATKPRNANPDSSRPVAAKIRSTGADSSHSNSTKIRHAGPVDSSHGSLATPRSTGPDSTRTAAARLRAPDSDRATSDRSKGSNFDSPASVRVIVPTPIAQPADKSRPNDSSKKPVTKSPLPYVNSDCHAFATDYDVDKLRVKMLEAAKDEERIAAALKVFKTKCFYTRQIKALSEVFTTDASKYRFFETAYPFAADEHFRELGPLLADPVYANKFKTLTGTH